MGFRIAVFAGLAAVLGGCSTIREVKVPVAVPCVKEPIRLQAVPLASIHRADAEKAVAEGRFSEYLDAAAASLLILNAEVKALKSRLEACQ